MFVYYVHQDVNSNKILVFLWNLNVTGGLIFVIFALSDRNGWLLWVRMCPKTHVEYSCCKFSSRTKGFCSKWSRTAWIIIISGTKIRSWIINVATEWLSADVKAVHLDSDLTINLSTSCANGLIISISPGSTRAVEVTVLLSALFFFF